MYSIGQGKWHRTSAGRSMAANQFYSIIISWLLALFLLYKTAYIEGGAVAKIDE